MMQKVLGVRVSHAAAAAQVAGGVAPGCGSAALGPGAGLQQARFGASIAPVSGLGENGRILAGKRTKIPG